MSKKPTMKASQASKHMSNEQLVLLHIYKKKSEPTTIEELQQALKMPRTTVVDTLRLLETDHFVLKEKEGKVLQFFPVPEISASIYKALAELKTAYVHALTQMRTKELKQLEEELKETE